MVGMPTLSLLTHPIAFLQETKMIALIRPVLMSFISSDKVKRLLVDMLRKLAEQSDNTVDDLAVDFIERGLFGDK